MPVNTEKLKKKLAQLETYTQEVRSMRGDPKADYTAESMTEAAAERRLEKAMQCAIDIASYIVANEAMGTPTQHKDVFFFLGRAGVLPPDLTDRLESMVGFRNRLVHQYETIEPSRVYALVQTDSDDLVLFAEAIGKKYLTS